MRFFPILLLALFAGAASASTVTFSFSGEVAYISDPSGAFNNLFTLGETYSGSVTYDVATTPGFGTNGYGVYTAGPDFNISLDIGGDYFTQGDTGNPDIITQQGQYLVAFGDGGAAVPSFMNFPGSPTGILRVNLYGNYNNTANDSLYNPSIIRLAASALDNTQSIMAVDFYNGSTESILTGSITSLTADGVTVSTTPEPGTLGMLGSGLLLAAGVRRKRRS